MAKNFGVGSFLPTTEGTTVFVPLAGLKADMSAKERAEFLKNARDFSCELTKKLETNTLTGLEAEAAQMALNGLSRLVTVPKHCSAANLTS